MFRDVGGEKEPALAVPESLLPNRDLVLPKLTPEVLEELRDAGWSRVGLMVAFLDKEDNIMMLEHNIRQKNGHGALGPLGETSQHSGPIIEQPIETLYRGIQEELGIQHPERLELFMRPAGGWVVNQWPRGDDYPDQYACAISFPVFLSDSVKEYLLSIPHGTEEVGNLHFIPVDTVMEMPDNLSLIHI